MDRGLDAIAKRDNRHGVKMCQTDVAERRGNPLRLIELGRLGHRSADVKEEIDRQIALFVKESQEQPIQPLVGVPIDVTKVIAGRVLPVIGELEAATPLVRRAVRPVLTSKRALRDDMEI